MSEKPDHCFDHDGRIGLFVYPPVGDETAWRWAVRQYDSSAGFWFERVTGIARNEALAKSYTRLARSNL